MTGLRLTGQTPRMPRGIHRFPRKTHTMSAVPAINVASDRLDAAPAQESTVTSPKRLARIACVLYLLVIGVRTVKSVQPDERIPAAA